jgi:site-specific DNA recombinase
MTQQQDIQVAIYARVSSERQAEECTIESQVVEMKQRVDDDSVTLSGELTFLDDGYSGETLMRPALERLRDQAAAGAVDRIYVHSPDRLARKYAYQVLLVDEWLSLGIEVVFLNHDIGKTPEENLLLQVQGMIAEYEHAKILERSRRGKRHKAKTGSVSVLSAAPYGYRYVAKLQGDGVARYEIVEEHARVVRQIYTWVAVERCSIGEVCRRLKNQGICSPKGKSYWDRTTVWGILKNPAYKGQAHFGKTQQGPPRPRLRNAKGTPPLPRRGRSVYDTAPEEQIAIPVPALIDDDLFDAAAEQLEENKRRSRQQKRGARYLLQGLTVCQQCGHAYYGKALSRSAGKGKKRDYAYYRCIGADGYRFGGQRICCNKQCRTDLLDKVVWDDLSSLLTDPKRLESAYEQQRNGAERLSDRDRQQLEKIIAKVKSGIGRLIDAYQDGLLSKDEFQPRMTQAKQRLEKFEADAEAIARQQADEQDLQEVFGRMQDFAARIQGGLKDADWNTRRDIIRALVQGVEIGEDSVRVCYKIGPPPFDQGPASRASLQHCWWRGFAAACERVSPLCFRPLDPMVAQAMPRRRGDRALRR